MCFKVRYVVWFADASCLECYLQGRLNGIEGKLCDWLLHEHRLPRGFFPLRRGQVYPVEGAAQGETPSCNQEKPSSQSDSTGSPRSQTEFPDIPKPNFPIFPIDIKHVFSFYMMDICTDSRVHVPPQVMIEDRKEGLRYVMSGEVTKGNVEKFLADFKEGKLEPFLKR